MNRGHQGRADCVAYLLAAPGIDARSDDVKLLSWHGSDVVKNVLNNRSSLKPYWLPYRLYLIANAFLQPTALLASSGVCLLKLLVLDFEAVADSARCIRMLLAASPRRHHLGLLATCWRALDLERLLHNLVEAWCATQWHPGARSPLQHHAPDATHGDDEVPVVHGVFCEDANEI